MNPPNYTVAAIAGILSHILYFIHGHRSSEVTRIIVSHIVVGLAITAKYISSHGYSTGISNSSTFCATYLVALFSSIITYRLFFHRLSRFPGPLAAKITKWYGPYIARNGQMHFEHSDMIKRYGSMVRFAPNELLLLSTDAIDKVFGGRSKCTKRNTGVYDSVHYRGEYNLDTILDREEHRRRRQVWDKALNIRAIEGYEQKTAQVVSHWLAKIRELKGQPINTTLFSLLISSDNMGRIGYSKEFGTIQTGKENDMLHYLQALFAQIAQLGQMSWPIFLLQQTVGSMGDVKNFETLACNMIDERESKGDEEDSFDIVRHFLQDYRSEQPISFTNKNVLYSDSQILLIAATDTIGAALGLSFYHLAKHQDAQKKLRQALAPAFGKTRPGVFAHADLVGIAFLDAVINETLRLDAPASNSGPRMTPPEGIVVDGVWIPGDVTVLVPLHSIMTSEKFFEHPEEFIPERWTEKPELIIDKKAFIPFAHGPFNCVGKRLAMMVLRLVISHTVWEYSFEFAPGEDGTRIRRDLQNHLVILPGRLDLVFHKHE